MSASGFALTHTLGSSGSSSWVLGTLLEDVDLVPGARLQPRSTAGSVFQLGLADRSSLSLCVSVLSQKSHLCGCGSWHFTQGRELGQVQGPI